LLTEKHKQYIKALEKQEDTFEYWVTEHLRMSGIYWGITAMALLGNLDMMEKDRLVDKVMACQKPNGGFGGNVDHDPHLLYTLSAVQILALYGELKRLDKEKVVQYVVSLQKENGSFAGDEWGEIDTRFSYCAVSCLSLLGRLDAINRAKAVEYILSCKNFDGGFGCVSGAESHAGQIFCCVGALAILGTLDGVDSDLLGWWLAERQTKSGGLNGRPEKKS